MQEIYKAYEWCNAVIISSPAYWRNVPAQLKAVFDRTYAIKNGPLKGKLGGAIAVGRSTSGGGQEMAEKADKYGFTFVTTSRRSNPSIFSRSNTTFISAICASYPGSEGKGVVRVMQEIIRLTSQ